MVARPGSRPRLLVARSWDRVARDLLSSDQTWRVHSVFERAANLRAARGDLLGLALAPAPDAPATVMLTSDDDGGDSLSDAVAPGAACFVDGSVVSIGDDVSIDLDGVVLWLPDPIRRTANLTTIMRRIELTQEIGARYAPTGGLAPLLPRIDDLISRNVPSTPSTPLGHEMEGSGGLSRLLASGGRALVPPSGTGWGHSTADSLAARAIEAIGGLVSGWRTSALDTFEDGARMLSGLGLGLTPSGDDLLAGFALGARAAGGHLSGELVLAIESAIVGRTTDLAVARVEHAVAGRADAYVDAVLRALVTAEEGDLACAVTTLLGYGHTSGIDTLVGLLLGVRLALE
jgi:hypothetical protein